MLCIRNTGKSAITVPIHTFDEMTGRTKSCHNIILKPGKNTTENNKTLTSIMWKAAKRLPIVKGYLDSEDDESTPRLLESNI